jgi:predicted acyltransferase
MTMPASVTNPPEDQVKKSPRLLSLDALRGFDMFWIISGEEIFHGFADVVKDKYGLIRNPANWRIATDDRLSVVERIMVGISNQLHHSPWNGFTFYDLIFPLFIFIAGVSMPFSYGTYQITAADAQTVKRQRYLQLLKRTVLLILLGMVVNGLLKFNGYEQTRIASVLGRIALACFFAAIIYLNTSLKGQLIWFSAILLGYWALMAWVPVPGYGAGVLTPGGNLSAYIDQHFLPGKLHRQVYDPEGLLSTIPAIATAMLGIFTGRFLKVGAGNPLKPLQKMLVMLAASVLLIVLGLAWGIYFPINKNMWTSSFTLYAGGWSLLLFAVFYGVIDVAGYKKWCLPFVWIGTNSILIYLAAHGLINFESTSGFLFGGIINKISQPWQHALIWIGVLFIQLLLLRLLYRKKMFLKL